MIRSRGNYCCAAPYQWFDGNLRWRPGHLGHQGRHLYCPGGSSIELLARMLLPGISPAWSPSSHRPTDSKVSRLTFSYFELNNDLAINAR